MPYATLQLITRSGTRPHNLKPPSNQITARPSPVGAGCSLCLKHTVAARENAQLDITLHEQYDTVCLCCWWCSGGTTQSHSCLMTPPIPPAPPVPTVPLLFYTTHPLSAQPAASRLHIQPHSLHASCPTTTAMVHLRHASHVADIYALFAAESMNNADPNHVPSWVGDLLLDWLWQHAPGQVPKQSATQPHMLDPVVRPSLWLVGGAHVNAWM